MAEAELLSSTSEEVCELFDGNQIVRVLGAPDTQEFIYHKRSDMEGSSSTAMVWGLREALDAQQLIFTEVDSGKSGKFVVVLGKIKNVLTFQCEQFSRSIVRV